MAEKENKPSVEELQAQIAQLEKLANYYMQKANQLEQQAILQQEDK
jgi:hypothetical protein